MNVTIYYQITTGSYIKSPQIDLEFNQKHIN